MSNDIDPPPAGPAHQLCQLTRRQVREVDSVELRE